MEEVGTGQEAEAGTGQEVEVGTGQEAEVGTGQEDKLLCRPGILHNYHNSHHTSALALEEEEGAHSPAGCLQRRVVEGAHQEQAGELLEVQVLEALEGMHPLQQVLEVGTGHGRGVLHSQEPEQHNVVPAVQPETFEELQLEEAGCLQLLEGGPVVPVG